MAVDRTTAEDIGYGLQRVYTELERRIIVEMSRRLGRALTPSEALQRQASGVDEMLRFTNTLLESARVEGLDQIARAMAEAVARGRFAAAQELRDMLDNPTMDEAILRASHVIGGSFPESDVARTMRREALRGLGISDPEAPTDPFSLQRDKQYLHNRYLSSLTQGGADLPGSDAVNKIALELAGRVDSTKPHILRWTADAYREVVGLASVAPVAAGIDTTRTGATEAWNRLLDRGITGFVDRAGKRWNLSTYVDMATRTGVMNATIAAHNDQLAAAGISLVRVSDVAGECPLCRPWEGKILVASGAPGERTITVDSALGDGPVQVHVAGSLEQARAAGLFHPSCRHNVSAYLPGASSPLPTEGRTADPDLYQARQELRSLERQSRRARLVAEGALDEPSRARARAKVRAISERISTLIDERGGVARGLPRRRDRERVNLGIKRDLPPPRSARTQFDSRTPEQRSEAAKRAAATRAANKAAKAAAAGATATTAAATKATKPKAPAAKPKAPAKAAPAKKAQPAKKAPAKSPSKAQAKPAKAPAKKAPAKKAPAKKAAKKAPPIPELQSPGKDGQHKITRKKSGMPSRIDGRPVLGDRKPEPTLPERLPPHPDASKDRVAVAAAERHIDAMIERGILSGEIQRVASEDVRRALYRQAELTPHAVLQLPILRVPATLDYDEITRELVSRGSMGVHLTGDRIDQGHITINPYWYVADGLTQKRAKRASITAGGHAPTGYGVGAEVGSTMSHEYGHHLGDLLSRFDPGSVSSRSGTLGQAAAAGGERYYDERTSRRLLSLINDRLGLERESPLTGDDWLEPTRHGMVGSLSDPEVAEARLDAWVAHNRDKIRTGVSGYGASSFAELLAEIWEEYSTMGAGARPEITEIGRMIQTLAEENAQR